MDNAESTSVILSKNQKSSSEMLSDAIEEAQQTDTMFYLAFDEEKRSFDPYNLR